MSKTCFFFCSLNLTVSEIRSPTTNYPYPRLINYLCSRRGWRVYVFAPHQSKPEKAIRGCMVLPYHYSSWLKLIRRDCNPDLAVLHNAHWPRLPLLTRLLYGMPLIYRTGGISGTQREINRWNYSLTKDRYLWIVLRFCSHVISTADGTPVHLYFRRMGVRSSRLRVWPNGFRPMSDRVFERKNWVLYLGRIDKIKAIEYIIDAFTRALPRLPADYKLIICGSRDQPTPFEASLKQYVAQLPHADRIEFHPWTRDAEAYYKQSRMLITGCANNQIMEAYACGTPVIALDLGETRQIYGHLKGVHIIDYPLGGYKQCAGQLCGEGSYMLPECQERVTNDTAEKIVELASLRDYPIPEIDFEAVGWEQRLKKEANLYEELVANRSVWARIRKRSGSCLARNLPDGFWSRVVGKRFPLAEPQA